MSQAYREAVDVVRQRIAGSPAADAAPTASCPAGLCDGTGMRRHDYGDGYIGDVVCDCRLQAGRDEAHRRLITESGLSPVQRSSWTFERFTVRRGNAHASRQARQFADGQNDHALLALHGPYGTGKSHLAAAIANVRIDAGQRVRWVRAKDYLREVYARYRPDAAEDADAYGAPYRRADLLVIDDIGTHQWTSQVGHELYDLIDHRLVWALPTVLTTNLPLDGTQRDIGARWAAHESLARIYSRLSDRERSVILRVAS